MAISLFSSVKHFVDSMASWLAQGHQLLDQNTANQRAVICAGCHNNKPTDEVRGGCSSCNRGETYVVNLTRQAITQGRHTSLDGNLKICGICGCDIRTMIWLPNQALLSKEDANAYPTFCWKKKILDNKEV